MSQKEAEQLKACKKHLGEIINSEYKYLLSKEYIKDNATKKEYINVLNNITRCISIIYNDYIAGKYKLNVEEFMNTIEDITLLYCIRVPHYTEMSYDDLYAEINKNFTV